MQMKGWKGRRLPGKDAKSTAQILSGKELSPEGFTVAETAGTFLLSRPADSLTPPFFRQERCQSARTVPQEREFLEEKFPVHGPIYL